MLEIRAERRSVRPVGVRRKLRVRVPLMILNASRRPAAACGSVDNKVSATASRPPLEVSMRLYRVIHTVMVAVCLGPIATTTLAAQQLGSITGRVTDAASGQPIVAVQVAVVGTNIGAQTNSDGQYTIRGALVGAVEVRALRVG